MDVEIKSLLDCTQALKSFVPKNSGNLLVAGQYETPLRVLSKYFPGKRAGEKALDWGCGEGHFSYHLMDKGFDAYAYAYGSGNHLDSIKQFLERKFQNEWHLTQSSTQDPISLPYPDESFEAVFSVGVLEHVRETGGNELGSLKEIYRILKPGGMVFVYHFPNRYSLIDASCRLLNQLHLAKKYAHPFLYTKKNIENFVEQTDFKLLESGLYNLLPRQMLRSLPDVLGNSPLSLHAYNLLEKSLEVLLKPFAQNYYFVAKK